jgi:hypothetical protein
MLRTARGAARPPGAAAADEPVRLRLRGARGGTGAAAGAGAGAAAGAAAGAGAAVAGAVAGSAASRSPRFLVFDERLAASQAREAREAQGGPAPKAKQQAQPKALDEVSPSFKKRRAVSASVECASLGRPALIALVRSR